SEVKYPATFHIGFIQESEGRVNEINQRLKDDGFNVPPPSKQHGSWTFYFPAPGGFTIEVLAWPSSLKAASQALPLGSLVLTELARRCRAPVLRLAIEKQGTSARQRAACPLGSSARCDHRHKQSRSNSLSSQLCRRPCGVAQRRMPFRRCEPHI